MSKKMNDIKKDINKIKNDIKKECPTNYKLDSIINILEYHYSKMDDLIFVTETNIKYRHGDIKDNAKKLVALMNIKKDIKKLLNDLI